MRSVPAATASIELRIHDNGTIECNWGTIAHGDPRPDLNQVGHLMLATATYVQELIDGGPQLHHGAQHSVTRGCHLHYDIEHHMHTAQQTRTAALEAQMDPLFDITEEAHRGA